MCPDPGRGLVMTEPYYQDDHVTIYHGDCLDVLPTLSNVDLFFTSPPYNLGTTTGGGMHNGSLGARDLAGGYGECTDSMTPGQYDEWQKNVVEAMWRCLSPSGAIAYNHKPRVQAGNLMLPTDYGPRRWLRQIIVWDGGAGINFSESFFLPKSEWIVLWAKPEWRLTSKQEAAHGDVWRIPPESDQRHPAPFPLKLAKRLIAATTAQLVCDPFAGSGTTLRAAKDLGRRAIGIEIEERYCEIAAKRCAQEVLPLYAEEG